MAGPITPSDQGREVARSLIDRYFRTNTYPYTRHHIDSYDKFLKTDLVSIIKAKNPILIMKELIPDTKTYKYKTEIWIGGESGEEIEIGTPTISLQDTRDVRLLFPNEARLRNLTYASAVKANIKVKITYTDIVDGERVEMDISPDDNAFQNVPLMKIPIMLHSSYCVLHNKPSSFLTEAGECPYDNGGYFIIEGSEKILITKQEQSFNTLYMTPKTNDPKDPKLILYASISCLSPKTRQVKRVTFRLWRNGEILVGLPFVRYPLPLFILFRALGFQTDEEIVRLIYPDPTTTEAKIFMDKLQPSIIAAYPFLNTYTAIQYIKMLTKGFGEAHVIDILRNQTFTHMSNDPHTQAMFLADCVRNILRVNEGFEKPTDRDDIRNQRCLTSGFSIQMLFNNAYNKWLKSVALVVGREHDNNKGTLYLGEKFRDIFDPTNAMKIFVQDGFITQMLMRGFRGKWDSGLGEEKAGIIQQLSRLSYCDFMSHCRRVVLEFDTSKKNQGPRRLHGSQYGYFCTSETPGGSSIGIAKNMSILTGFSVATNTEAFEEWLRFKMGVFSPAVVVPQYQLTFVPVYLNGGLFGFTVNALLLKRVLTLLKRTGCLPYSASITLSVNKRKLQIYMDDGRPIRPLVVCEGGVDMETLRQETLQKLMALKTWRDLVCGTLPLTARVPLSQTVFVDPLADKPNAVAADYVEALLPYTGALEYVDPYEQNEAFLVNFPEQMTPETTHIEVHPSTILSLMTSLIPFCHHNQSPRNQLGDSQSKQAVSLYASNWQNRFDNSAHVLCYGESHLVRSIYSSYLGEGRMPYGHNIVLAIAFWSGYNQDDGIVFNYDAFQRGLFRSMSYRSYEMREEIDPLKKITTVICNPATKAEWTDLRPGSDYTLLDNRGIIKEGSYCDENTVIVGAYTVNEVGQMKDNSLKPQVWTRGRVEKVVVTVNNANQRLVKVRIVQDRIPELGDKFCLTPDHEVLTTKGWVPIANITMDDTLLQMDSKLNIVTNAKPLEVYKYSHVGEVIEFITEKGSQCVTLDHRMYLRHERDRKAVLVSARMVYEGHGSLPPSEVFYIQTSQGESAVKRMVYHEHNPYGTTVHCVSVPAEIFMVRRFKSTEGQWTGNSNRHGQKGTIGVMLRGHDMPRSRDGIVPDMIMNPHAIPSRMTIAQNLEQLFGKAVALAGSMGDATAFMNDGSPEGPIGSLLEKMGYEKYGNEILYNGATGEQIPSAIFVGPVYGMRLKHMVEDKWQARAQGRKEQMTHQPTGGRGNQGGLKIGEMDRDAIVGHGIAAFVNESFMKRSDGARVPLCTSCGTIPIYNPSMRIAFCTMCNGPPTYVGDSVKNLELLPPMERQKGRIVEVEMPYATKVVTQEIESYMNIGMRMITTADTEMLRPFELSAKSANEVILPRLVLPEVIQHEELEEEEPRPIGSRAAVPTQEDLVNLQASLTAQRQELQEQAAAIAAAETVVDEQGGQAGFDVASLGVPGQAQPFSSLLVNPPTPQNEYAAFQANPNAFTTGLEEGSDYDSSLGSSVGSVESNGPPPLESMYQGFPGGPPQVPLEAQVPGQVYVPPPNPYNPLVASGVANAPTIVVPTDAATMAAQGLVAPVGVQRRSSMNSLEGGTRQFRQAPQSSQYSGGSIVVKKLG
uniref:DNA-directed RNA polymerase n=1 Tax=viral metagenome TaxID=1070528 RepID=A0A6C0DIL3_9ZZZZ